VERAEILAVVLKHVRRNVHLPEGRSLDPSRPLAEQGVSSLDAVEISYGAMRELKIQMGTPELMRLRTVDQLVDLLHQKS
jgi:acyl carrier protein